MSAQQVCRACGLCCDGTLFVRVPLDADESPPPPLVVIQGADERRSIAQPCAALDDGDCAVYAQRPRACRAYACLLLGALGEGELSLPEALTVVAEARARVRRARATATTRRWLALQFGR